jgi:hypothetical protein
MSLNKFIQAGGNEKEGFFPIPLMPNEELQAKLKK